MPRTYTTSGVTIIGDGEESGVWGTLTNTNLQILDRMISQAGAITLSGTTHTLTISDGALSDGQYAALVFGGSPTGTNTVTITPNDARRLFFVKNDSGETVTLTQGSGGNVSILDGRSAVVYCDGAGSGAEVVDLSTTLVTETAQDIGALTPTDGNFIVGNGTTWVSEAGNTVLASLGVTATATELNTLDGITASTAEINLLDGVTWTLTDYNTLTSTAADLNLLDGKTLSGNASEIITGLAGTAGQLTQWNVNGDLVAHPGTATQSEANWEAGTSTTESLVSPAKVKAASLSLFNASGSAPVYACRAWVNFQGTGTVAIRASGNVSSITDLNTGNYRIHFATDMPDENYAVTGFCNFGGSSAPAGNLSIGNFFTPEVDSVRVISANSTNAVPQDAEHVHVAIFR